MKTTQYIRVRDYLRNNYGITQLEATHKFGITRLAAVIFLLRSDGYVIDSENIEVVNRYGEKTRVTRYHLVSEPEVAA